MNKFGAGIVSYNPDISRLQMNIEAIKNQVRRVIIVDNGSKNVQDIKEMLSKYINVDLICNTENKGIASALNQICNYSKDIGIDWCLLLDQDSVCSENLIKEYSKHIEDSNIGMLCPYIVDEYKTTLEKYKQMNLADEDICNYAITSGSLVKLEIWKEIGGFFEDLFIDGVDADYSYNLRIHGYYILRVNKCYIMHQQGNDTEKSFLYRVHKDEAGKRTIKPAYRFNYSMMRWYYMARNNWILIKKYKKLNGVVKPVAVYLIRFLSVILIEKHKVRLIKSIIKGFRDGVQYKIKLAED